MKNIFLIFSILFIMLFAVAQSSINKNSIHNTEITSKVKKEDTIKINLQKKSTVLPVKTKESAKLIMVKETVEADYWKYIFPVFTLILGVFLNKFIDFIISRRNLKRIGKTWTAELIGLEASLISQKKSLTEFEETFNDNNYEIPNLKIYGDLDGKNFESLQKSDLLKYIENRYKNWQPSIIIGNKKENENFKTYVKATNKILGYIDVVKFNYNTIAEKHRSYLSGISTNNTILNNHLQDFRDALGQYQIELEREAGFNIHTDQRITPINIIFKREIIDKMRTDENINPLLLPSSFCQPILLILSKTRDDVRTNSLRLISTAILNTIEAIKAERTYMKTNSKTLIHRFEESTQELPTIINLLTGEKIDK